MLPGNYAIHVLLDYMNDGSSLKYIFIVKMVTMFLVKVSTVQIIVLTALCVRFQNYDRLCVYTNSSVRLISKGQSKVKRLLTIL